MKKPQHLRFDLWSNFIAMRFQLAHRSLRMAEKRVLKTRTRYSIGEWYGRDIFRMDPESRRDSAKLEIERDAILGKPCPYRPSGFCNKKGGVCTLRLYEQLGSAIVAGKGSPVAVCPSRFFEAGIIHRWVGETILGTPNPIVLSEIGFLDRLKPEDHVTDEEDSNMIGRIDNVLLHPDKRPLEWCALEIQAVYFSGKAMQHEFKMLSKFSGNEFPYPAQHRRPDWRSSGPKRLLPQLQTKTPTIRTWGKKVAVVVDEPFFESLVGVDRERHLSNAEIVWFVVGYEPTKTGWNLIPKDVVFTKLESSIKALTGGTPLPKEKFEDQLLSKLRVLFPKSPLLSD